MRLSRLSFRISRPASALLVLAMAATYAIGSLFGTAVA